MPLGTIQLIKRYGPLSLLGFLIVILNVQNYYFIDPVFRLVAAIAFIVYIFWITNWQFGLGFSLVLSLIFMYFKLFDFGLEVLIFGIFLTLLQLFYSKTLTGLIQREKYFHSLADHSPHPLVLASPKGEILFASKSIADIFGINKRSLIGRSIDEFVHDEDKGTFRKKYTDIAKKPLKKNDSEVRIRRKDGTYFWVKNDIVNLLHEENVRAIVSSFQDITRSKELDQARAASLKREKDARAVAEEAVRSRDEFLSIASHELKNPLTTVILQLQNTLRRTLTQTLANFSGEDLVKSLRIADHQSDRLSKLISDLLNVSLVSTGKLQLEKEKVDLSKLVSSLTQRLEAEIKLSNCKLSLKTEESLLSNLDMVRVEQAISNVLLNALKYGRGKPIEVSLVKDQDWAIISIEDHGPGIPTKYQKIIFEPFKRVNNSEKGLGVGLFIAKQIVEAHGGNIKISSTPHQGSKFTLRFPLKEAQSVTQNNELQITPPAS